MVREPLRCFLIVALQPSVPALFSFFFYSYRLLHIHKEVRRLRMEEETGKGVEEFLISSRFCSSIRVVDSDSFLLGPVVFTLP